MKELSSRTAFHQDQLYEACLASHSIVINMKSLTILQLLPAFLATTVLSKDLTRCGALAPPPELRALRTEEVVSKRSRRQISFTVNTHIHIITTTSKADLYRRFMVQEQMKVMNSEYKPPTSASKRKVSSIPWTTHGRAVWMGHVRFTRFQSIHALWMYATMRLGK